MTHRPLRWMAFWCWHAARKRDWLALVVLAPVALGLTLVPGPAARPTLPEPEYEAPQPPGPPIAEGKPYWYTLDGWLMISVAAGRCDVRDPRGSSHKNMTCFIENEQFADYEGRKPKPLRSETSRTPPPAGSTGIVPPSALSYFGSTSGTITISSGSSRQVPITNGTGSVTWSGNCAATDSNGSILSAGVSCSR